MRSSSTTPANTWPVRPVTTPTSSRTSGITAVSTTTTAIRPSGGWGTPILASLLPVVPSSNKHGGKMSESASVRVLASGEQVKLTSGRLRLTVVTVGGGLRELTCDGWAVLDGYGSDEVALGSYGRPTTPVPRWRAERVWGGFRSDCPPRLT